MKKVTLAHKGEKTRIEWQFLALKNNEHEVEKARKMAKEIGVVAQQCVDWAVKAQNEDGSYGYAPNHTRSDQSVTSWWIMGLKSAYVAGLNVPDKTFTKLLKFIRSFTNEEGRGGYTKPFTGSERMSAASNTCLQFLGDLRTNKKVIGTAKYIIQPLYLPSAYDDNKKDFYLMYYQALGLFQMGVKSQYWKVFNEPMKTHLLGTQVKVGTFKEKKGSWNYDGDKFGREWGRVGQTALGALMLEVYYRYKQGSKVGKRH